MPSLVNSSEENLRRTGQYSISIYDGELTTECIVNQVKKLKQAFPALPKGFYDILTDRIQEIEFSDKRLTSAVNNLIDTCVYPIPTIANLITWDRRVKLYTYRQMVEMTNEYGAGVWDEYKAVKAPGINIRVFASVLDIETYILETL